MIIGGGQIYKEALVDASLIHVTEVDLAIEGDTWFPELPAKDWSEVSRVKNAADGSTPAFDFVVFEPA